MRAVVMEEFGGPEVLRVRQVEDPVPGPGQVLVSVGFASVTFVETQVRGGRGPAGMGSPPLPRVPGNGVGGPVVAVGPDVDPSLVGTVVVTTTGGTGGYAELALASADDTVPVPAGLELRDAVALLADGRTALLLHRRARVRSGEWVLVTTAGAAAAGGADDELALWGMPQAPWSSPAAEPEFGWHAYEPVRAVPDALTGHGVGGSAALVPRGSVLPHGTAANALVLGWLAGGAAAFAYTRTRPAEEAPGRPAPGR